MFSNSSIFGFSNRGNSFLHFVSERNNTLLSLKKVKETLFKILLYFLNTIILIRTILFFVPDSLVAHYLGTNSCWYNFGISVFTGSVTQLPGSLLRPLTCTLLKPGITYAVIEVFIAAMVVVGIIALYIEDKYASQKPAINGNVSNSGQMGDIIGDHIRIKREQKDKNNFVPVEDDILPEVFRISGGSRFCWLDMYGENVYGPILWEEKSEESKNED